MSLKEVNNDIANSSKNFLTIDDLLVPNPSSTVLYRMKGDSMINENIFDRDILIVDRNIKPKNNQIVIVSVKENLIVYKYFENFEEKLLKSNNFVIKNQVLCKNKSIYVWGVVTYSLRKILFNN
tara:strand:- start:390 stop:761 length:372 start_codon:yes stop_codon:yes gene_type:complete